MNDNKRVGKWVDELRSYNNYALIADNCNGLAEYKTAMLTLSKAKLYEYAQGIAIVEEVDWRVYDYVHHDDNVDTKPLWAAVLRRLDRLAATGDLPQTGDDWWNLLQGCEAEIKKNNAG